MTPRPTSSAYSDSTPSSLSSNEEKTLARNICAKFNHGDTPPSFSFREIPKKPYNEVEGGGGEAGFSYLRQLSPGAKVRFHGYPEHEADTTVESSNSVDNLSYVPEFNPKSTTITNNQNGDSALKTRVRLSNKITGLFKKPHTATVTTPTASEREDKETEADNLETTSVQYDDDLTSVESGQLDAISKESSNLFSPMVKEEKTAATSLSLTPNLTYPIQYLTTDLMPNNQINNTAKVSFDKENNIDDTISQKMGRLSLEQQDSTMRDAFTHRMTTSVFDIPHLIKEEPTDNSFLDSHEDILARDQPVIPQIFHGKKSDNGITTDAEKIRFLQEQLQQSQTESSHFKDGLTTYQKQLEECHRQLEQISNDYSNSEALREELNCKLKFLMSEKNAYNKEMKNLRDTNNKISSVLTLEKRNLKRANESIEYLQQEFKTEKLDLLEKNKATSIKLDELKAEKDLITINSKEIQDQLTESEKERQEILLMNEQLLEDLSAVIKETSTVKEKYEKTISSLKEKLVAKESKLKEIETYFNNSKFQDTEKEIQMSALKKSVENLENKVRDRDLRIEVLDKELKFKDAELLNFEYTKRGLIRSETELKDKLNVLNTQMNDQDIDVKRVIEYKDREINDIKKNLSDLKLTTNDEIGFLKNILKQTELENNSMKSKLTQLNSSLISTKTQMMSFKEEKKEALIDIEGFSKDLSRLLEGRFEENVPIEFFYKNGDIDLSDYLRSVFCYSLEIIGLLLSQIKNMDDRVLENKFRHEKLLKDLKNEIFLLQMKKNAYEMFLSEKLPIKQGESTHEKLRRILSVYSKRTNISNSSEKLLLQYSENSLSVPIGLTFREKKSSM